MRETKTGVGVYKSAYKNAMRLARTETNMAYRKADNVRWSTMDFIVGQEVRLSNNHTTIKNGKVVPLIDICDTLQGKYPKDFVFTGWHPQCRCYTIPIMKTEEENAEDLHRILSGEEPLPESSSVNFVKNVPDNFKQWSQDNAERIDIVLGRGKEAYFIRDNKQYIPAAQYAQYSKEIYPTNDSGGYRAFDKKSGGYVVTHKEHNIKGNNGWQAEQVATRVLVKNGNKVILGSEKAADGVKVSDGLLNSKPFDIREIIGESSHTIGRSISTAGRKGVETVVLYFNDIKYKRSDIERAYKGYINDKNAKTPRNVKEIICIADGKIKDIIKRTDITISPPAQ
jgi:hypothetical protein